MKKDIHLSEKLRAVPEDSGTGLVPGVPNRRWAGPTGRRHGARNVARPATVRLRPNPGQRKR
jgi:hypothetical protein